MSILIAGMRIFDCMFVGMDLWAADFDLMVRSSMGAHRARRARAERAEHAQSVQSGRQGVLRPNSH